MIIDGKLVADQLKKKIEEKLSGQTKKEVCFIIFGNNSASRQFIGMKCRFAESLNIPTRVIEHPENLSAEEAGKIISETAKEDIAGIVIQLPLPSGFPVEDILNMVPVELDIDVLSRKAKESYINKTSNKIPPVSRAIMEIFNFYNVSLTGKEILVIGTGRLVGEPVRNMLESLKVPFSVIDKDTDESLRKNLIASADVIISGAGSPYMIKPDMIKKGVVLIDAGTSEQNGKIVGDVDPTCESIASLLTPVPRGVGPVTLASLFLNI